MSSRQLITVFERSDGTQWVFVSGLVLSLAGNLLIYALAPEPPPRNFCRLLIAAGCFGFASGSFSLIGWMLQRFEYVTRTVGTPSTSASAGADVKHRLVSAAFSRLFALGLLGLFLALAGIAVLVLPSLDKGLHLLGDLSH